MIIPTWLNPTLLVGLGLSVALGVQTVRLYHSKAAVAEQKLAMVQLQADIANARARGAEEGAKLQQAAQAVVDAKRQVIEDGLLLDAAKRQQAAVTKAAHLAQLLEDGKWLCLRTALPNEVLKEYAR